MSYIKLKSFVAPVIDESGKVAARRQYEKSATIDIFIETSGDLRMFVKVPNFMYGIVSSAVQLTHMRHQVKGKSEEFYAITGRDPDSIEKQWRYAVEAYKDGIFSTEVVPVIRIKRDPTRGGDYARGDDHKSAYVVIEFDRMLSNVVKKDANGRQTPDFEWNDAHEPLVKRNRGYRDETEWYSLPYDQALWDKLLALHGQLVDAQARVTALIESGDIVKALAGPGFLQLGKE